MLYSAGLEEVIFSRHEFGEFPDELIIISGYLGPAPIERLADLPMRTTVIGGMYSSGIDVRLWAALEESKRNNPNISLYFTEQEIHSKIYIWRKNGRVLHALIGSANFSSSGLRSDYRETLADASRDTYLHLNNYYNFVLGLSVEEPLLNSRQVIIDSPSIANQYDTSSLVVTYSYDIPLYSTTTQEVPPASGLNWGLSRGHVAPGDGYIRLPSEILSDNQGLIRPFDTEYVQQNGSRRKRNSDPVELVWDDGTIMEASLEGYQRYNGRTYPKQLASYSSRIPYLNSGERISVKSILGRYIRHRLGVGVNDLITRQTLLNYGRDTITLSLIEDGVYYIDFSV